VHSLWKSPGLLCKSAGLRHEFCSKLFVEMCERVCVKVFA
jgi:hypothetical protein